MQKKNEMKKEDRFGEADAINLENAYELEYWTSQLKVTPNELRKAVAEVGNRLRL